MIAVLPFLALFGWLERQAQRRAAIPPDPVRLALGTVIACLGIGFFALQGTTAPTVHGLNILPIAATRGGIGLAVWSRPAPQ